MLFIQALNICLAAIDCNNCDKENPCHVKFVLPMDFLNVLGFSGLASWCSNTIGCDRCPILNEKDECDWGASWTDHFLKIIGRV